MAMPEFTAEERYLIESMKSDAGWDGTFMYAYLLCGSVFFGFGLHHESSPLLIAGMGTFVVGRIYEERYWRRWKPVWRSVFAKFEAGCGTELASPVNQLTSQGR